MPMTRAMAADALLRADVALMPCSVAELFPDHAAEADDYCENLARRNLVMPVATDGRAVLWRPTRLGHRFLERNAHLIPDRRHTPAAETLR